MISTIKGISDSSSSHLWPVSSFSFTECFSYSCMASEMLKTHSLVAWKWSVKVDILEYPDLIK